MLTALRISDNIKIVGNDIEKDFKSEYVCDFCRKKFIHHKSVEKLRTGHFKHYKGESDCLNQTKKTEYHRHSVS
jgi:hypothetical protein